MSTQFDDTVEEHRTIYYTKTSYRQEEHKDKLNSSYNILFDFGTITSE